MKHGKTIIHLSSVLSVAVVVALLSIFPLAGFALQTEPAPGDKSRPGWKEQAEILFQEEDWQKFFDWCLKWTESEPENAYAWLNLGNAYVRLKRHIEAMEAFRRAVQLDPELAYCKCE